MAMLVAVAMAALLGACSEDRTDGATANGGVDAGEGGAASSAPGGTDCTPDTLLDCARTTSIEALVPDAPIVASGEPIVLGMINQENTPVGSFPELSRGVQAAIEFVNSQLGGLDGRPLQLEVCNTNFSAEGSTACGQQFVAQGVPVVLGGIDVFGNGIDVLADNDVPYAGGIPISTQSVTSPNSFQWSGGTWGATIAFASYAVEQLGATSAAIVYGDFGSVADAAEYGRRTFEQLGIDDVTMVPFPIVSTDLAAPIQVAASAQPDVMIALTADTGCAAAFEGVSTAAPDVPAFYTGACAAPSITDRAGPERTEGAIFNVEGPIDRTDGTPDTALYDAVIEAYGDGLDPIGAATVSFRSFMNLYVVLAAIVDEAGVEGIDPESVTTALRSQVDATSFMGHPYTCDGRQLEGLPAMCSPQQILAELRDGQLEQIGTWVDVGAIYGAG
jgi:branched-chain amino acid transport system substrate-binding protein